MDLCVSIDEAQHTLRCAREAAEIVTILQEMYKVGHTVSITLLEHGFYEAKRDHTKAVGDTLLTALRMLERTPFDSTPTEGAPR